MSFLRQAEPELAPAQLEGQKAPLERDAARTRRWLSSAAPLDTSLRATRGAVYRDTAA